MNYRVVDKDKYYRKGVLTTLSRTVSFLRMYSDFSRKKSQGKPGTDHFLFFFLPLRPWPMPSGMGFCRISTYLWW